MPRTADIHAAFVAAIERNQPGFADKTTDGSDNHYWILRNMGRVH